MGSLSDLDKSVEYAEKAMEKGGGEGILNNYALIMRQKFKSTNAMQDLSKALELCRKAVEFYKKRGDPQCMTALNTLGLLLLDKYKRTSTPCAIEEAIMSYKEALQSPLLDLTLERALFANLGGALVKKHEYSKCDNDLDEAVECGRKAIRGLWEANPLYAIAFGNFSEILEIRYLRKHYMEDLTESIHYAEKAINCLPKDHFNGALLLDQLGRILSLRLAIESSESLVQHLIEVFTEGWNCTTSLPFYRIQCAQGAAKHLFRERNYRKASDILEAAVKLMSKLSPSWVSVADQQIRLSGLAGLAANAAMVSLKAGDELSKVLEILEQGRGVILGDLVGKRSEIVPYNNASDYPALLREFNMFRMQTDAKHSAESISKILHNLDRIIGEIRSLPGHERFLLSPRLEELTSMAKIGPIVVIFTSQVQDPGISLLIRPSGISSLPLKELTHLDASRRMESLPKEILKGSLKSFWKRNEKMKGFLGWLWDAIVGPVLEELGFTKELATSTPLPHIRWIGVGSLSQAPFHAAGYHSPGSKQNAMSRVISSYVPTLRTLAFSQEKQMRQRFQPRFLTIAIPETSGALPLPHVKQEITEIRNVLYGAGIEVSVLEPQPVEVITRNYINDLFDVALRGLSPSDDPTQNPSRMNVLKELPQCDFVHFACHGVSDSSDPSQSHLLLLDGKLTVEDILDTHAIKPALAFLSACSTAQIRHSQSMDECLHIAGSFLMAGFEHVIGTLWETNDNICQEVACSFYRRLFRKGKRKESDMLVLPVPETLHAVIDEIRQREYDLPLLWAGFVLHGA